MPSFQPIAIVGRGCILPGALDPAALWRLIEAGRCVIEDARDDDWAIGPWVDRQQLRDAVQTRAAGLVRGFAASEPSLAGLDPLVHWLVAAGRQALGEARFEAKGEAKVTADPRAGLIIGNLSYPTTSLSDYAQSVWSGQDQPSEDPRNRFMSGLPAQLAANALQLGAGGFALDAACASSLYAIELACRRLAAGEVDLMLAGGVNHADDLFLHLGFRALRASSPTGRSRPFHREADGLVPAHGAALIALRRLDDALARGERVLAVIRGVGLSNDGRAGNMMAPCEAGQARAMRAAYAMSGLSPAQVSYVECHATGTPIGDRVELRSMRAVFAERDTPLAIGSLKANLGHLITASGAASVLKVIAAMEAGRLPATPSFSGAGELVDELGDGRLRALAIPEPWTSEGPRIAAVSNFGFGGNNAHLILEQWTGARQGAVAAEIRREPIAVTALRVAGSRTGDPSDWAEPLFPGAAPSTEPHDLPPIELSLGELRTPPVDLELTLPQQLSVLRLALDLQDTIAALPSERTGIFAGMQCDAEIARTALRYRHDFAGAALPRGAGDIEAALVLGCMPNVVANRISAHFDLRGPCFSVSAEEASGTVALDLAVAKLGAKEIDAALVAAVDLSREPVQAAAAAALLHDRDPSDAAVLLVLERLADARARGAEVLAVIEPSTGSADDDAPKPAALPIPARVFAPLLGHSHAAAGLLAVATTIEAARRGVLPPHPALPTSPWLPDHSQRRADVRVKALGGLRTSTRVAAVPAVVPAVATAARFAQLPRPRLAVFTGEDMAGLRRAVVQGQPGARGPLRLAIVGRTPAEFEARRAQALAALERPSTQSIDGVYFSDQPLLGPHAPSAELAFVFTGPASAYPGMGRELGLLFPELVDEIAGEFASLQECVGWIYGDPRHEPTAAEKLWASSYLIQLHAKLTRKVLGMRPQAAIGYCAGESNALFALGAWQDFEGLARDIHACDLYTRELGGDMDSAKRIWGLDGDAKIEWATLRVLAPIAAVRDALANEPRAHLTIVNGSADVVIAGEAGACQRVIDRVGNHRARSIGYDFIMHCPEARGFEAGWRALHHRPTTAVPGVRFYTHAQNRSYTLSRDAVADALTGQAMGVVDFPALIEQAYADGVRVFLEHGPLSGCSKWIGAALGDRPHLAVPMDRYRESAIDRVADSLAQLFVAGVEMELAPFLARLEVPAAAPAPASTKTTKKAMRYPMHWDRVALTASTTAPMPTPTLVSSMPAPTDTGAQQMAPAPALPPVVRGVILDRSGQPRTAAPPIAAEPAAAQPVVAQPVAPQPVVAKPQPAASRPHLAAVAKRPPTTTPTRRSLPQPQGPGPTPSGPSFDRAALEVHARGTISTLFGPRFAEQDRHAKQVRMPCPPLLLADRVTGITGEPATMGLGTCWTETDVRDDAWYLHEGRMPAGIFVESGQADLFLISWLGADLLNAGERVYRLLGCELTSYGPLPKPGDVLQYDIHVDGHAAHGDVRLFFFHYDCRINGEVRMSVRNGQAGFFTYDELDHSAGVLWDPSEGAPTEAPQLDAPPRLSGKTRFEPEAIVAFSERRLVDCFGPGFERAKTHTRTPAIAADKMRLVEQVTHFDAHGGPWGRGYMRATLPLERDSWFYAGHFHQDPCMPGTLMFEGGLQAMAIYMSALGCTLERDGWRFEPVAGETWKLSCRGQAVPGAREMVYEIFVDEFIAGPQPTLFATMLGSVDGRKAFHCPRIGLRLVPDWPLEAMAPIVDTQPAATTPDGFRFDHDAMIACAWGKPSRAFGALYRPFDGGRRVPRLPGPPYHFMTRIRAVEGPVGAMAVGSIAWAEYEVPADAWYFEANGNPDPTMAFSVLMEIALQPCGWLASYCGFAASQAQELFFRNLDGKRGVVHRSVRPDTGTLITQSKLVSASSLGAMIIVGFEVEVCCDAGPVYTLETVFGFFPAEALANQAGLPTSDEQRAALREPCPIPARIVPSEGAPGLARGMLATVDRVTGLWLPGQANSGAAGGYHGLGRIRTARDIDPGHWYFRAHFFQDPVQPGSIGVDAMLQSLRLLALELGMGPSFEVPADGEAMSWKYRGQVVPENQRVDIDIEVTRRDGPLLVARGSLWVDGKRIYEAEGLSLRAI